MEIWHIWTGLLANALTLASSHFGVSEAVAIIALTLLARTSLLPISLIASFRMELNKQKMLRIKPDLDRLKETLKDNPSELASATMRLYKERGVTFFDRLSLLNMGTQGVFGIGIFQVLRQAGFNSKFLWIASIAKPDVILTVVIGALMLLAMGMNPGATANSSMMVMLAVSVALMMITAASMPSAVGIYWATSSVFTLFQSLALRGMLASHRQRAKDV
jgi:YidC/Oxa1 family membrane protein insertase